MQCFYKSSDNTVFSTEKPVTIVVRNTLNISVLIILILLLTNNRTTGQNIQFSPKPKKVTQNLTMKSTLTPTKLQRFQCFYSKCLRQYSSIFIGLVIGANLLTVLPSPSIRNLVKFHFILLPNKPFNSFFRNL
jgi:hypothetical protein